MSETVERGTLWSATIAATTRARQAGALQPIATRWELVLDGGVPFVVRVLLGAGDTQAAQRKAQHATAGAAGHASNPFLPYEPDMFVADISPSHVCLLNKFTVLDHHLLIVTRAFEPQEAPLTEADFAALWTCLDEIDGLAFYNAGWIAGASQQHKHLQLAPLPLGPGDEAVPIERLLPASNHGEPLELPSLPFRHVYCYHGLAHRPCDERAKATHELYRDMLRLIGVWRSDEDIPEPYNWLMTGTWALAVPRFQESVAGIAVNALGFAGCLLVRNASELRQLKAIGPLALLAAVAQPPA